MKKRLNIVRLVECFGWLVVHVLDKTGELQGFGWLVGWFTSVIGCVSDRECDEVLKIEKAIEYSAWWRVLVGWVVHVLGKTGGLEGFGWLGGSRFGQDWRVGGFWLVGVGSRFGQDWKTQWVA